MKSATIEFVVTDQGNGGSYCSECLEPLNSEPDPKICPNQKCKAVFTGRGACTPYAFGGSDF